jgi:hypothetical protein
MSDSTMEDYLNNPWATREEQQRQQEAMARRRYEEMQRAHEATMREQQREQQRQQRATVDPNPHYQRADPVDDLGTRFAGLGYPTQQEMNEQRWEQERIRERLRAQQETADNLHRQMGGQGGVGGGFRGGGGFGGGGFRGGGGFGGGGFGGGGWGGAGFGGGGFGSGRFGGGGWGPDPSSRPMHFPDTEPSINITESLVKMYMKKNDVPRFDGEIGLENLRKWHMDVEQFAKITGLSENATINLAWTRFGPSVSEWFQDAVWKDFGIAYLPQDRYPFGWEELKAKMTEVFASAFSSSHVWAQLVELKRKKGYEGTKAYIARFLELAKLVGQTPYNVYQGDRAWEIIYGNLTSDERLCVNTICVQNAETGRQTTMQTILNSIDQTMLANGHQSLGPGAVGATATATVTSTSTTTPMDLTAISKAAGASKRGDCTRCGGVGHWAWKCGTPRDWKPGQQIDKPPRKDGGKPWGGADKKLNNAEATLEQTAKSEEAAAGKA